METNNIRSFKLVFLSQLAAAEKWHESLRTAVGARAISPLVLDTQVFRWVLNQDMNMTNVGRTLNDCMLAKIFAPPNDIGTFLNIPSVCPSGSLCADASLPAPSGPPSYHPQQAGARTTAS